MEEALQKWLKDHSISFTEHLHPAVFTVPEAEKHCGHIPGTHIKNLFIREKGTDRFFLITIPAEYRLNLKKFRKMMNIKKFRFANEANLMKYLGITPGAVSPLGLINDKSNEVIFIVDARIWDANAIVAHPNINTASLEIPQESFHRLIEATNNRYMVKYLPLI